MWNIKYNTNAHTCQPKNRLSNIEDRLVAAKEERGGEGKD